MSLSEVKGNVIYKCRVHKEISNSDLVKTALTNLLVSFFTGRGLTSFDLSLTDDVLYVEALRFDTIGLADVAYTDAFPRKDIKKFEVIHDGIKELVTLVAMVKGKEKTFCWYRDNTSKDFLATIMQGLLEPSYVEE